MVNIPPEDMLLCNNAAGCDTCQWATTCFVEDDYPREAPDDYYAGGELAGDIAREGG